jgi:menaquinone-specific isochorismate synthase
MPVIPYSSDLFKKCKEIYQFLSNCQRQAAQDQHAKIASISFELPEVAPWIVLEALSQSRQVHFYYDNASQQQSVVALEVVIAQQSSGPSRFARIQQFIQVWRKRILYFENTEVPFSKPHFFCGFTFFDDLPSGDSLFEAAQVFLPRVQVSSRPGRSTVSFNCLVDDDINVIRYADEIGQQFQQLLKLSESTAQARPTGERPHRRTAKIVKDVGDFRQSVTAALQSIEARQVHKVVLADAVEVLSVAPFKLSASLKALRVHYPDCSVFSIGNGQGQQFIGASPERLLSIRHRQLITDALAGSAPRGLTPAADATLARQLLNSPKERYEHQVVVEFIVQQLRALGLEPEYQAQPVLLQLSNIQHLHTPIRARLPLDAEPLDILERLHPTPAVAGLPRAEACDLIPQLESFQRELYAAPLGWVDAEGNSEFVVGIRSALIEGRQARLFAGAGIVAGSNPEKELAEIRLKLQALLGSLV